MEDWCFKALVNSHQALLPGTAIPLNELLSWHLPCRAHEWGEDGAWGHQTLPGLPAAAKSPAELLLIRRVCIHISKGLSTLSEWQGSEIQTPDNGKAGNIKERKFFCCIAFPMAIR